MSLFAAADGRDVPQLINVFDSSLAAVVDDIERHYKRELEGWSQPTRSDRQIVDDQ